MSAERPDFLKKLYKKVKNQSVVREFKQSEREVLAEEVGYLMTGLLDQYGSPRTTGPAVPETPPISIEISNGRQMFLVLDGLKDATTGHFVIAGLTLTNSNNYNDPDYGPISLLTIQFNDNGAGDVQMPLPRLKDLRRARGILEYMKTVYAAELPQP